jgi:phosphatidylglycerophosphate synthase
MTDETAETGNGGGNDWRRPLRSRGTAWSRAIAAQAIEAGLTPNQISMASMAFAAVAGGLFWLADTDGALLRFAPLILGAAFVQLRLLCNLIDGMVAVEGGWAEPDGPFWNEFPDRVADVLILGGAGAACGQAWLGLLAAALAVMTAYVREMGTRLGMAPDFSGPMAKPHRMAAVTAGAVLAAFAPLAGFGMGVLTLTLWVIVLGTAATVGLRSRRIVRHLLRA